MTGETGKRIRSGMSTAQEGPSAAKHRLGFRGSRRCMSNRESRDRSVSYANTAAAPPPIRGGGQFQKLAPVCPKPDLLAHNAKLTCRRAREPWRLYRRQARRSGAATGSAAPVALGGGVKPP